MYINKTKLIKSLLCYNDFKIPITSSHYVCSNDLNNFASFLSVEKTLTNFTSSIKNIYNKCNNYKKYNYL